MPDDLVTAAEAADILGVSLSTLHRIVRESDRLPEALKAPGLRGARWFRRTDVETLRDEERAA